MPSGEHESPIALVRLDPGLLTWLLTNLFDVKVPDYHHARAQPTDVRVLVPRTYHADGMLLFCDATDEPVLAVVLEIQRGWDSRKRWMWKLYVAQLEAELKVNAALVVYCPDPTIARRYRGMFEFEGLSLPLRPFIFTPRDVPLVVDVDLARANPALAVLSAICHGTAADVDAVFPALAEALRALGPKRAILYYDIVLAGLPRAPRARWEAYMSTTVGSEFRSELLREVDAHGEARGEARGEGRAVLTVLETRGVPVSEAVREQILTCTDLAQLDIWLRRAVTAVTAEDVVSG
ncbi:hypothetical protein ABNF97_20930 [Plantactinospora sp. B6F1]|uniref:hypothetical protein n=1 Tax=Plantactinospora sp. B6F1 TaxID=3158971 RepID=UPI0032D9043E